MKGIIAEIDKKHMIVLSKNGDFVKCKKLPNCSVGDEVNLPKTSMNTIYKRISAVAAGFMLFAMLSSGAYAYYTPYSYVSVDINPSLELAVNRFDKVIKVHAFNQDAEKLLETVKDIKNKNVDTAMEEILNGAADEGYIKKNESNSVMIVVSSSSKKEEKDLSEKLSKASTETLSQVSSDYEVILEKTKLESYKKAKEQNVSPGKVILADKFKEVKPELDKEEIKQMPLSQAIKQIEKKEDASKKPEKPDNKPAAKPNQKKTKKGNVVNVKELIKEKNEELGKKLEKENSDKAKDKDKDKEKNNNSKKNETTETDKSTFNNTTNENQNTVNKQENKEKTKEDKNKDNTSTDSSTNADNKNNSEKDTEKNNKQEDKQEEKQQSPKKNDKSKN